MSDINHGDGAVGAWTVLADVRRHPFDMGLSHDTRGKLSSVAAECKGRIRLAELCGFLDSRTMWGKCGNQKNYEPVRAHGWGTTRIRVPSQVETWGYSEEGVAGGMETWAFAGVLY